MIKYSSTAADDRAKELAQAIMPGCTPEPIGTFTTYRYAVVSDPYDAFFDGYINTEHNAADDVEFSNMAPGLYKVFAFRHRELPGHVVALAAVHMADDDYGPLQLAGEAYTSSGALVISPDTLPGRSERLDGGPDEFVRAVDEVILGPEVGIVVDDVALANTVSAHDTYPVGYCASSSDRVGVVLVQFVWDTSQPSWLLAVLSNSEEVSDDGAFDI